jgi:hypothetical protein
LQQEFENFKKKNDGGRLAIELFGGEPLTNFPLIKQVYQWVKSLELSFPLIFQITTNGTLFTPEVKIWLEERKEDFRIVMSVDGTEAMQAKNRECSVESLPTEWVKKVWPNSYFKMTLTSETIPNYSDGLRELNKGGYRVACSLAQGAKWKENDHLAYQDELENMANYFLENPTLNLEHPFNLFFHNYLDESKDIPPKNCGCSSTIGMYDIDGRSYPCHLFLPIVHGKEIKEEIDKLDFSNDDNLVSSECRECKILKACSTCYGYNFVERECISKRDLTMCKLRLAEIKVISAFQIKYFMAKQESLTNDELLMFKAAYNAYGLVKELDYSYFEN